MASRLVVTGRFKSQTRLADLGDEFSQQVPFFVSEDTSKAVKSDGCLMNLPNSQISKIRPF